MIRAIQPGEVVRRLASPGFFAPPPHVVHADRIPKPVRDAQAPAFRSWFPPRAVRIAVIEDAYVAGEGLVFTPELDVIDVTVREHDPADIDRFRHGIMSNRAALAANTLRGAFVLCRKPGARNYGHWLAEMLPRAWLARQHWQGPLGVMIQDVQPPLRDVMLHTLLRAGFPLPSVLGFGEAPFRVERVLVVDGLTEHGSYMSPLVAGCLQELAAPVAPAAADRILVTRAPGSTRRFAAEDALAQAATEAGFLCVDPATVPFDDQVALFKGARKVAGAMGAGLANAAFCLPGTELCVAAPVAMPDTFFWFLAALRRLSYTEIRCAPAAPSPGPMPWDAPLALDPPDGATLLDGPGARHPWPESLATRERLLAELFDAPGYLTRRGLQASPEEALLDYIETGWRLGLDPSAGFSTDGYLLAYPDVARADTNPLAHFIEHGHREGRSPLPT